MCISFVGLLFCIKLQQENKKEYNVRSFVRDDSTHQNIKRQALFSVFLKIVVLVCGAYYIFYSMKNMMIWKTCHMGTLQYFLVFAHTWLRLLVGCGLFDNHNGKKLLK